MPIPGWVGHINKRLFNKLELRKSERPILTHVGRTSGRTYRTPLDAYPVDGGYIFILMYGTSSDWVRNILASGNATLTIDGQDTELVSPRVIGDDEAWSELPDTTGKPPGFLKVTECLRMDLRS